MDPIQNQKPLIGDLISVVIPTYNRPALTIDALKSVYNQDYRPIEILVVDDGSKDETAQNVDKWLINHQDHLISGLLLKQKNKGGNSARNLGIKNSRGKYIAFLDSDDCWLPEKLSKQLTKFNEDDIGAVYCGMRETGLGQERKSTNSKRAYPHGWILKELLIKDVTAPTSTYIIKKEVFNEVGGFDESLQARQDWDMWIRIASKYQIQCVQEVLVEYRLHTGTRTASNPEKELIAYGVIRKKYKKILNDQTIFTRLMAKASFKKRVGRVHLHFKGKPIHALKFYMHSLFLWPFDFDSWAALLGVFMPKKLRQLVHQLWNVFFGKTLLAIRSH